MADHSDLLIEIGTEELPPTALRGLSDAFGDALGAQFRSRRLGYREIALFAAPRRLAVLVTELAHRQPEEISRRRGPALAAAFGADGVPTKAALGFAASCGVDVRELGREETDKGSWLAFDQRLSGQETTTLIPEVTTAALAALPIPKRMRWGSGDAEFVRPVHWVCVRFGEQTVSGRVLGVEIGTASRGHRFHAPGPIEIKHPGDYAEALRHAFVEPSFEARRAVIAEGVARLATSVGGVARIGDALLDEVAALCEWPVPLLGHFDERFLDVPREVLIETMQKNQKYFPVFAPDGSLSPYFIAVSNIESRDPEVVRSGNERVIRPRFSDAKFFWEQDRRHRLADRRDALKTVVFQHQLGSVWDKTLRVAALSRHIAAALGYDATLAERAALLGKCDLVSQMVGEFASLQGTMGRYYAEHDGEDPCVVAAMEEQYLPRQAGDSLPESRCGQALALADRLDTLIGIFAIGQRPTGVKDPYGLRRAAISVLRILIETPLALDLKSLLEEAAAAYPAGIDAPAAVAEVFDYAMDRLEGYYGDRGIGPDTVASVLAVGPTMPSDIDRRIHAVAAFRDLEAAAALSAANKRIRNILKKSASDTAARGAIDRDRLVEPAELALADRLADMQRSIEPLLARQDYAGTLRALAELRADVDRFFDEVMVMAEDAEVRANRVAILRSVEDLFLSTADIARLQ